MSSDPSPKPRSGLSLYANLLEQGPKENSATTISGAPVVYRQAESSDEPRADEGTARKQQLNAAALRFQPTKRPQVAGPKKTNSAKLGQTTTTPAPTPVPSAQVSLQQKSSIADWAADGDEDDYYFGSSQRQRGGRKRRKKNKDQEPVTQNWDDIYDPSRPNSYEEYKNSEEVFRELREWKDKLYAHRIARRRSGSTDSDAQDTRRPAMQFAPPPPHIPPPSPPEAGNHRAPPPPAELYSDETGEEAFARRIHQSQTFSIGVVAAAAAPMRKPDENPSSALLSVNAPTAQAQTSTSTISRAPVRYSLPNAPEGMPKSDAELEAMIQQEQQTMDEAETTEDTVRSIRPGQSGFAERLMAKYGWTKGHGLGANSTGIITPLQAKLQKQKKKPDSEGGGYSGPGGIGKIFGGKRNAGDEEGKFGRMSEVVALRGMLDGMDLQFELGEGNLMQEIGEECGEKYGRVERVFVDQTASERPPVFIKFTSQLSALRAVNALEGRVFNGNTIEARLFDSDKFDAGLYK